ncbi:MAG: FAD-binding oxidoreductase [Woeseiaceae bacterium]|nr:FAD-binding oxidoreductase [Woeseiaceae bacterium]
MAIRRRTFLKVIGAATASRVVFGQGQTPTVGVVGGGIVGASIAFHLSSAGADVVLFEKKAPAAGATSKSFAWINAHTNDPHYRSLRLKSIAAYRDLDKTLGLNVVWGGAINWATTLAEAERLKASSREFRRDEYDSVIVGADELAKLVPNIRLGSFEAAIFNSMDGHIDPVEVTRKLLAAARSRGTEVVIPCEVNELKFQGDRLTGVSTTMGDFSLDRIVIAGGVDTPELAAQTGYSPPLKHAPGILLHTTPQKSVLGRVMESVNMNLKQNPNGRLVGNDAPYAPDLPVHQEIIHGVADMPEEIRAMHGERILEKFRQLMPGSVDANYDFLTLGYRPMPEDGMPVAGFSPGSPHVYLAVMHSGVTLAPIMGRYITRELLMEEAVDELAPYRPHRFAG